MIEATQLAGAAIALLAPYLKRVARSFSDEVGEAAWSTVQRLYDTIKARLAADEISRTPLERLERNPDDERAQGAVEAEIARAVAEDPGFKQQLETLLEELVHEKSNPDVAQSIENAGAISVYGSVNISGRFAAGRDINMGQHPSD